MSRNLRRRSPATPVKAAKPSKKRRGSDTSSSLSLSDDDGYSAVDDISDSEDDDEEDVDAVEEENIVTEQVVKPAGTPRPQQSDEEEEEEDEDEDDDDEEEEEYEGINDVIVDADGDESASWPGILSEADDGQLSEFYHDATHFGSDVAVERHVRFAVPSSESDSTETEEDDDGGEFFPDIFVSQNSLDPAFRREIEDDPDDSSGSGTFWDYHGQYGDAQDSDAEEVVRQLSDDDTPMATPMLPQDLSSASTPVLEFEQPQDLDGYETDGDTTEEDIPEPIIRKKTRRPSNHMSEASDSEGDGPVQAERGQPRLGRFKLDRRDKKPIAVLNPLTRKMMIFTPHRRRHLDLSPEQFNFSWPLEQQSSPILSNSASMMLSAMFSSNTFGDFVNTQAMGPAEAFFPFPSEGHTADESSSLPSGAEGEDEDDGEKKLDISDFITWDNHVDEMGSSGDEAAEGDWEPSSTPVRPRPNTASSDREILSHLNSDTVGAFRRNQINQQLILSNKATQDSLAFSGPYNYTAIRGLKSDRFDTAGMPLTPVRRHKKQLSELARSPLESLSAKRKASGEVNDAAGHKKQRSISDVNYLHI